MKKIIFFLLTACLSSLLLVSCGSSRYSGKKKGESVDAGIKEDPAVIHYALFEQQQIPSLADRGDKSRGIAVGQVLSMAGKGVMALINMERKKYTAGYSQEIHDLMFYDQISSTSAFDPIGMQFNGFSVLRMIKTGKHTTDTAFYAEFEPDLSNPYEIINNSFFRLKVKELRLKYTKAKVASKRWYLPWSWTAASKRDHLNMDIEIVFRASWVTADGHFYENAEIGKFKLPLRGIPLHPGTKEMNDYFDQQKGKLLDGRCILVPRSYGNYYNGYALQSCCTKSHPQNAGVR